MGTLKASDDLMNPQAPESYLQRSSKFYDTIRIDSRSVLLLLNLIWRQSVMAMSRYDTSGMIEDQYEPGTRKRVLRNIPGIRKKKELETLETEELLRTTYQLIQTYDRDHRFTTADICSMHKEWLGSIYEWAGRYRQVMISKAGFPFASPAFIPDLMNEYEKKILSIYTPCIFKPIEEVVHALAVVHTELLLIHPFREGNGRLSRLLIALMALQAGLPLLDFSNIHGRKREEYFEAVRTGMRRDYTPMERIFTSVVSRTLRISGRSNNS
jgi:cell filamentation protein